MARVEADTFVEHDKTPADKDESDEFLINLNMSRVQSKIEKS